MTGSSFLRNDNIIPCRGLFSPCLCCLHSLPCSDESSVFLALLTSLALQENELKLSKLIVLVLPISNAHRDTKRSLAGCFPSSWQWEGRKHLATRPMHSTSILQVWFCRRFKCCCQCNIIFTTVNLQLLLYMEEIDLTYTETFKTHTLINPACSAKFPSKGFGNSHLQIV